MTQRTRWGSWELTHDATVLSHDGRYAIALADISDDGRDIDWWIEHLEGKGWGTTAVLTDFWHAAVTLTVIAR